MTLAHLFLGFTLGIARGLVLGFGATLHAFSLLFFGLGLFIHAVRLVVHGIWLVIGLAVEAVQKRLDLFNAGVLRKTALGGGNQTFGNDGLCRGPIGRRGAEQHSLQIWHCLIRRQSRTHEAGKHTASQSSFVRNGHFVSLTR